MAGASEIGPIRVRPAGEDDLATIGALLRALGYSAGGGAELRALLRETLDRPDLALFLALGRDTPRGAALGLIALSQRPQLHLGGVLISIDTLAVREDMRGRGLGRRLLRRARAYARLHHAVRIEVHTTRARENYRRGFYPANGYREANSALFRREIAPTPVSYDQPGEDTVPGTGDEARMAG